MSDDVVVQEVHVAHADPVGKSHVGQISNLCPISCSMEIIATLSSALIFCEAISWVKISSSHAFTISFSFVSKSMNLLHMYAVFCGPST